jgi:hypothetical protein
MHLIQLLLPLQDGKGQPIDRKVFDELATELTERFGGLTAYTRAPATGLWEEDTGYTVRDQVVVYEVMADELNLDWWAALRQRLEIQLAQDELVVRTHEIRRL